MRHHLLLAAVSVVLFLTAAARVDASAPPDHPRGVVLVDTAALKGFDGTDRVHLPANTVVQVIARTEALHRSQRLDWLGAPSFFVRAGAFTGWVNGEDLAVDVQAPAARRDLGWRYEPGSSVPLRIDGEEPRLWFAVREAQEWNEKNEWFDHDDVAGFLVTESKRGVHVLRVAHHSGWGSSAQLQRSVFRDLTGDGTPELLLSVDEYVTEVGYGGRVLQVIRWVDGKAELAHTEYVHNPTWNGLSQDTFGWLTVDGDTIRVDGVDRQGGHCGEDSHGRRAACVSRWTRTTRWSKEGGAFATKTERRGPVSTLGLDLEWYSRTLAEEPDRSSFDWVTW